MVRLSELNPSYSRIYRDRHLTADNGGFPTDRYTLSFDCPACGHPYRISINVGPEAVESTSTWKAVPLPDGADWTDRVTIEPSIRSSGHGRRHPTCGFHATIIKGKVVS